LFDRHDRTARSYSRESGHGRTVSLSVRFAFCVPACSCFYPTT
jgi:hypothetical protein